jgi:stage II sporulation protein D
LDAFVRGLTALVALLAVVSAAASAQPNAARQAESTPGEALFVITGRGWGHGVGMGQYGANGMANAGSTYDEILAHYYTGTEIGRAGRSDVRVLLTEGRRAVTISSPVPFSIVDATGAEFAQEKGAITLKAGLKIPTADGPVKAKSPIFVRPGKRSPLSLDTRLYRGRLEVAQTGAFVRVVNHLPLQSYLEGVVAGEMPHTWHLEALRAQAVAARSYALATLQKGKPFDLYSDVRSQVYQGVAGEKPRTTEAVRSTAGEIVTYGGKVATTYYFSTSGGRTASAADVFGFSVPYLVSRPDPYDKASPHHRWGPIVLGARTVQSKLAVDVRVLDATGVPTPSGRLRSLTLQTVDGPTTVPASLLRSAFGLRSTWVSFGVLRLDRPRSGVVFGSSLQLSGVARAVTGPVLAASADGSSWAKLGAVARDASGLLTQVVKPTRTTRYRIEATGAASPALLVGVAPLVRLVQPVEFDTLAGSVKPKLPGALVTIERRQGQRWKPVKRVSVDANGSFRAELALVAGSYRARVAARDGYLEGVAPPLQVTP